MHSDSIRSRHTNTGQQGQQGQRGRSRARIKSIQIRRARERRIRISALASLIAIFVSVVFLGFAGFTRGYASTGILSSDGNGQQSAVSGQPSGGSGLSGGSEDTGALPGGTNVSDDTSGGTDGNVSDGGDSSGVSDGSGLSGSDSSGTGADGSDAAGVNGTGADGSGLAGSDASGTGTDGSDAAGINGTGADSSAAGVSDNGPALDGYLSAVIDSLSQTAYTISRQSLDSLPVNKENSDKVTILGVGDNLIHTALIEGAKTEGGYDFSGLYANVRDLIQHADIATINQETPLATTIAPPAGYPAFNTPTACGDALIDAGFDVINHANNHVTDMGEAGIEATLSYWSSRSIPVVGIYRSAEDRATIRIIEQNGIRVAFLGFLESFNSSLPENTSLRYTRLDWQDQVKALILKAKSEADIVVVHAHWGDENEFYQTSLMEDMAQKMVDWGADVIFGSHPHVLQDLVFLKRAGTDKSFPVIYSLGNFVSGQLGVSKFVSGMLQVTAYRDRDTGATMVDGISFYPTITHYTGDRENVTIIPAWQYSNELAAAHGRSADDNTVFDMSYIKKIVFDAIPEQYVVGLSPD